jgi:hypothetical protein
MHSLPKDLDSHVKRSNPGILLRDLSHGLVNDNQHDCLRVCTCLGQLGHHPRMDHVVVRRWDIIYNLLSRVSDVRDPNPLQPHR